MNQKDLAHLSGLKQGSLSRIESGKQRPMAPTLRKIARGLGVSLAQLLEPTLAEEIAPMRAPEDESWLAPLGQEGIADLKILLAKGNAEWIESFRKSLSGFAEMASRAAGGAKRHERPSRRRTQRGPG
jgi:transcriptional regulator with XRE-family HTH domain